MELRREDREALIHEKYGGNRAADLTEDLARLAGGEPLAYVIGHIPFLGLTIHLDSHPLIPRPETEWWTEQLLAHLRRRFGNEPFHFLDLCAGSGAIGLAVLKECENAQVSFGELVPEHAALIQKNVHANNLDARRANIRVSNLFESFAGELFAVIATNPPYIPETRALPDSVARFEPLDALYAGADGLALIRSIIAEAPSHLTRPGEVFMECDTDNVEAARVLLEGAGGTAAIQNDQYGRPRLLVGYFA